MNAFSDMPTVPPACTAAEVRCESMPRSYNARESPIGALAAEVVPAMTPSASRTGRRAMPALSRPTPASEKNTARIPGGMIVSRRPPGSAACEAVMTMWPVSSGRTMPTESAQISFGSPGTARTMTRVPSVMGGGAFGGTGELCMRSAQARTVSPGVQPSAAAVLFTWLMMPCASVWSPSPMWQLDAEAVAAARPIWSR